MPKCSPAYWTLFCATLAIGAAAMIPLCIAATRGTAGAAPTEHMGEVASVEAASCADTAPAPGASASEPDGT